MEINWLKHKKFLSFFSNDELAITCNLQVCPNLQLMTYSINPLTLSDLDYLVREYNPFYFAVTLAHLLALLDLSS